MIMTAMLFKAKESRETREKTSQTSPKKPVRSLGKKPNNGQQAGSEQVRNYISDSDAEDDDVADVKNVDIKFRVCMLDFQDLAGIMHFVLMIKYGIFQK